MPSDTRPAGNICKRLVISWGVMDFLEKLQKKPRPVRVMIMWTGVAVFMTFLFIFWVWTLGMNQSVEKNISQEQGTKSLDEMTKQIPTLWQSLKAGIGDIFQTMESSSTPSQNTEGQATIEGGTQQSQTESGSAVPPSQLP
jgi:Na+-transporting methylmalonyl-CoA/oxaloacetate decarboxylase gamma subunit